MLDTTGAGDAFTAGFLYQITQVGPWGRPWRECSSSPDLAMTPGLTGIDPPSLPCPTNPWRASDALASDSAALLRASWGRKHAGPLRRWHDPSPPTPLPSLQTQAEIDTLATDVCCRAQGGTAHGADMNPLPPPLPCRPRVGWTHWPLTLSRSRPPSFLQPRQGR